MKELEIEFDGRGEVKAYFFRQIERNSWGYIYEKSWNGRMHYEVFEHKIRYNPYTKEDYVRYPNSNAFGYWAWTCMTLNSAKYKLTSFIKVNDPIIVSPK